HVWAARALVPSMIERGGGYLLNTASAAGLLTSIGAAPYAVTKHAAVSLAEWLAITHGDQGIRVSVLCPLGVQTQMLEDADKTLTGFSIRASGPVLTPEQVAEATVKGMEEERFLILPHPEVTAYMQRKVADYDKWLAHMRKVQAAAPHGGGAKG
ncbi:MAG TPA: SDR family NAD(P)-dependent oxidoreductase, partial [Longimicrobium sp.]|nr:SDR family NAD(P)-dependent oxidoreductase [Longimicrobium sp.]